MSNTDRQLDHEQMGVFVDARLGDSDYPVKLALHLPEGFTTIRLDEHTTRRIARDFEQAIRVFGKVSP